LVVGLCDHDHCRRNGERVQNADDLEPIELGHPHVEEHAVVRSTTRPEQCSVRAERCVDLAYADAGSEDPHEALQLRSFVVDRQQAQPGMAHRAKTHAARVPAFRSLASSIDRTTRADVGIHRFVHPHLYLPPGVI